LVRISDNIQNLKEKINMSLQKSIYTLEEINLVAVTKNATLDQVKAAYDHGIINIGENKVQKLVPQMNEMEDYEINWHFIGHLQTNKVKYIIDRVNLVQSLDRYSLARELNKRAEWEDIDVNVLVQVNIALEDSKYGLNPDKLFTFVEDVLKYYPRIKVKGLMTIAPFDDNPEVLRPYFYKMRQLFDKCKERFNLVEFDTLSMGMSNDYQIALEEGANMIRVGSALFK